MPTLKRVSAQREGISVRTRWGWGPSASAKKLITAARITQLPGFYSCINANVQIDPPVGTLLAANRLAMPPPSPDAIVTYCRPLYM